MWKYYVQYQKAVLVDGILDDFSCVHIQDISLAGEVELNSIV